MTSVCDWKAVIDSGNFIVIIIDKNSLDNEEVEIQCEYAKAHKKTVLAMIESPCKPPEYMTKLNGFMYESFQIDSQQSFRNALKKLIQRHQDFNIQPTFLCFNPKIKKIMRRLSQKGGRRAGGE